MDIFVSDIHLGTKDCNADLLERFLKKHQKDINELYLVGDIVDMWRLSSRIYWPQSHVNLIRRFLQMSKKGVKITYIIGNHDGHFNKYTNRDCFFDFGDIKFTRWASYNGYLVLHGDQFDHFHLLAKMADKLYGFACLFIKRSGRLKNNVKSFFQNRVGIKEKAIKTAISGGYKGIICGHTHVPVIEDMYINCGDMIENFTLIVFENGTPRIIRLQNNND